MSIVQFVGSHFGALLAGAVGSSSILTGFALHFAGAKLPAFVQREEEMLLEKAVAYLTLPEDIAAAKAVMKALEARFPDAGAALFAQGADAIIRRVPALKDYRQDLIELFAGIDKASKAAFDKESAA